MRRLTDGERDILAELARDANASADDLDDLMESADCLEDVFGELLDAAGYQPEPIDSDATAAETDAREFPF